MAHRNGAAEAFDLMYRQSFDQAPERGEVSERTIRAINGGIRGIVYRRLRGGQPEQLRDHLEELVEWGLLYQRPGGVNNFLRAIGLQGLFEGSPTQQATVGPDWKEPPDSARSRSTLSQRERILRATAIAAGERGYSSLTIPAITAVAGVSNQTFYAHFKDKQEAFGTSLYLLGQRALALVEDEIGGAETWVTGLSLD